MVLILSLLPQGEGCDCMDAGGRAMHGAIAEDEGDKSVEVVYFTPHPVPLPGGEGEVIERGKYAGVV